MVSSFYLAVYSSIYFYNAFLSIIVYEGDDIIHA